MDKKTVLLVDDEEIILATLGKEMREAGYEVITAESGEKAAEILKGRPVDLVVTDLKMEGMNGIQVLENVKKINHDLPVIILTGFGDMYSAIEAMRAGADDYLLKPCAIDELLVRAASCIEKYELRKKTKLYEEILPICSVCKKIRDDSGVGKGKGEWLLVETYIAKKTGVAFTHSYCDQCYKTMINEVKK